MKTLPFLAGLMLCAGMLVTPLAASAEDPEIIVAKVASVAPARTPWADLLKLYRKQVKKGSAERVKMRVYLGGIKGDEQSIVRQVFKGTDLQIGGVSTGAMAVLVPDMDILELPYLFESFEEADRILDIVARPYIEKMLAEKGFKLLMLSENGYRSFGSKGGFIKSPADLDNRKMRSQESPVHVETYRALGASPVTISVGEVLSALQTGVVEGFDNTPLFTQAVSWHQAVDHYTVTRHIYQPAVVFANKAWFDGLPAEVQNAMTAPIAELEPKGRAAVRALGPLLLKNFEKQNVAVYTPTEAELDVFRKATRPVWAKRRESASDIGKEMLDAIIKAKAAK